MRVGGPARRFVEALTDDEAISVLRDLAADEPLLVLGGGSNLVVADAGFDGTVLHLISGGIQAHHEGPDTVVVTSAAGVPWSEFVRTAVARGWSGVECLIGIPGTVGATPVQNVGAYGHEVAEFIREIDVYDRQTGERVTIPGAECGFAYRHSALKGHDRYVVLHVTFVLAASDRSAPVKYSELARRLGVEPGATAPAVDVMRTVLELRRSKGMVLEANDHDTWSCGSFFTNPIIDPELVPEGAPAFGAGHGKVKTSAAWLIQHAGFEPGYPGEWAPARLSTKHTLALTNRGGATAADIANLARTIRDGVRDAFGITLVNEPIFIGHDL